jgi:hypothetical protein
MVQEKNIVRLGLIIIVFIALLGLVSTPALAKRKGRHVQRSCSKTASSAYLACSYEARDDYWIAKGNCYNLLDAGERAECFADAKEEYKEAKGECQDQLEARKDLCEELGEAPYDPINDLSPTFVNPDLIGDGLDPNQYFPLVVGNTWVYEGGDEKITVTVTEDTVEILGVTCREVSDVVEECEEECSVIEDTKDWFAQDTLGNVWYFGERSVAREDCEEDGCDAYLLSDDGSWIAGVDGAQPGIIIFGEPLPEVGTVFRQEFALGDAEDAGELVSINASPEPEVENFECNGDCLQTRDFTPIEPDAIEFKYYLPGTGLVLEVDPDNGERVELTEFITP